MKLKIIRSGGLMNKAVTTKEDLSSYPGLLQDRIAQVFPILLMTGAMQTTQNKITGTVFNISPNIMAGFFRLMFWKMTTR